MGEGDLRSVFGSWEVVVNLRLYKKRKNGDLGGGEVREVRNVWFWVHFGETTVWITRQQPITKLYIKGQLVRGLGTQNQSIIEQNGAAGIEVPPPNFFNP